MLRGETELFRTIVERHQTRIFFLGLKFFRRPEEAEDFAQEVFVRAYQRLASFKGKVPFAAWLYRVAFHLAVNRYRVRKRSILEVKITQPPADPCPSPEARFLHQELLGMVRKVLKRIPEIYHVLIKMHFFEGLSYPEISRILQIPVNTIKSYVFRAKGLIREKLAHYLKE